MKIIGRDGNTIYFTCEEDGHTYYGSYEREPIKDAIIVIVSCVWFLPPMVIMLWRWLAGS
jgi:hypothetical protein